MAEAVNPFSVRFAHGVRGNSMLQRASVAETTRRLINSILDVRSDFRSRLLIGCAAPTRALTVDRLWRRL
jgi:hypothetical protein